MALGLAGTMAVASPFATRLSFRPAQTKHLMMHIVGQKMAPVFTKWTALFRTDVVQRTRESALTKEDEWGLSRSFDEPIQHVWGFLTHDGSAGAPMYDLREGNLDFLEHHMLRLPYVVASPHPKVLVLGVGGGRDILTALHFGASRVTGLELDPTTVDLIQRRYADMALGAFEPPRVTLLAGEGRHFVASTKERYDVIQITGADTLAAQTSGAYVLAENYLYTSDAVAAYLDHLNPNGLVSFGLGELTPERPQALGRMVLNAKRALRLRGVVDPAAHIIAVSSNHLQVGLLVSSTPFAPGGVERMRAVVSELGFEPVLLPEGPSHPTYETLLNAEGPSRDAVLASLPYVIDPVTDDAPFFFRFCRWRDVFRSDDYGAVHGTALGQLVLVLLAVSLTSFGAAFILAPLAVFRRRGFEEKRRAAGVLIYFLALGAGFMLLEISLMQRFVFYLGYPTYALSVVLFALLLSLGFGSFLSQRWPASDRVTLTTAVCLVGGWVLIFRTALPSLFNHTIGSPFALRVVISVLILFPLGTILGVFFPLGIRRAAAIHPDLVPWAWGVNGCASVTASVGAVILAMQFGFVLVWILAVAIYVVGAAAFLRLTPGTSATGGPQRNSADAPYAGAST